MTNFKRLLGLSALLLACVGVGAAQRSERVVVWKYDLDSAGYTYCVLAPQDIAVADLIKTTGSSATVAAVAGSPFTSVAVGDEITYNVAGTVTNVTVVARASATSITVDRAVTIPATGAVFQYKHLACGTADTDGWFSVPNGTNSLAIVYQQGDLTGGLTYSIESRNRGSYGVPMQLDTGVIAATTALANASTVVLGEVSKEWRVGLKYTTADPADNATNLEQVGIILSSEF